MRCEAPECTCSTAFHEAYRFASSRLAFIKANWASGSSLLLHVYGVGALCCLHRADALERQAVHGLKLHARATLCRGVQDAAASIVLPHLHCLIRTVLTDLCSAVRAARPQQLSPVRSRAHRCTNGGGSRSLTPAALYDIVPRCDATPDMPLASGRATGAHLQSAPSQRPLSNTRPPAQPELSRTVLRPACRSVGPCSI